MNKQYLLGLYEKAMPNELSWEEKFNITKEAGFDFIEISIDETDEKLSRLDMSLEERSKLLDLMNEYGVKIRSMCLSGHRKYPFGSHNWEIREKSMEIMKKALILADDLGIRTIQLAGYDVYYEESDDLSLDFFIKNLREAVLLAAKYGIMLGFETMETEFMNTVRKSMYYVNKIKSPYLGVYPDLGNLTNAAKFYETDLYEDLEYGRGHIAAMHLKETVPGVFRNRHYGDGHVDFEEGIKKAWDLGVRRFVTEFWYQGDKEWEEEILSSRLFIAGILDKQVK